MGRSWTAGPPLPSCGDGDDLGHQQHERQHDDLHHQHDNHQRDDRYLGHRLGRADRGRSSAKLSKADTIDLKITANEAKIAAYEELQSLLSDVADAADALRAVSGSSNSDTDVFLDRAAYLTANGDVDASAALSATVDDGSDVGSYDIQILQLAKTHKIAGSTQSSKSDDLGLSGVVSLGVVDGDAVEVTITDTMSLADIADAINAESDDTGVQATVLQVSSSSYRLVLTSVDTGETIAASAVSGDDVLNSLGLTDSDGAFADVLQEAQDAILTLDGIEVTRSSNDIDDLLDA